MLKRAIQYQAGTVAAAHAREKRLHHRNRLLEERVKTAVSAREALRRRCARMLSTDHIVMGGRRMRLVAMQQDAGTPAGKETFSTVPINEEGNDVMDEEASADIRFRKRKVRCFDNLVTVEKGDPPALSLSAATPAAAPSPPPTPAIRAQVRNSLTCLPARPGPPLPAIPRPPAPPSPPAPLSPPLTSRPPPQFLSPSPPHPPLPSLPPAPRSLAPPDPAGPAQRSPPPTPPTFSAAVHSSLWFSPPLHNPLPLLSTPSPLSPASAPNTPRPACGPSARPCPPRSARRAAPVLRAFLLLSPPLSSLSLSSHPSPLDPNYPFCPLSPLARWSALAPDSARSRRRTFCRILLGDSSIAKTTASGPPRRGGPLAGVLLQAPSGPGRHGTSARRGWSFTGCLAC